MPVAKRARDPQSLSRRLTTRQAVRKVRPVGTYPVALARFPGDMGPGHHGGSRESPWVGTQFAILDFSHRLSLPRPEPGSRESGPGQRGAII
jgi:hypothetical protein